MTKEHFLAVDEHFDLLCKSLPDGEMETFNSFRFVRVETAYSTRHFIIYQMGKEGPVEIDRLTVLDFDCNDEEGMSVQVSSKVLKQTMVLDYTPRKVFGHDIFMWLPLHAKIRWSATKSDVKGSRGSLGFPIVIRTKSRFSLTERGVTHCETGPDFAKQFGHDTGI